MAHHYGPPRGIPPCKPRPLTEGNTMHNPKPPPSVNRPPAPWYIGEPLQGLKHITRLDTDKPGLYIVKLATIIPDKRKKELFQELHKKINVFAPGSELVILPSYVEAVEIQNKAEPEPSDAWMNERIGKKETVGFPVWQSMATAPEDRYILIRDKYNECEVVMWSSGAERWMTSGDEWCFPIVWMECPK